MDIIDFLKTRFIQCSSTDLRNNNNFEKYNNFRQFIYDHYTLLHLEKTTILNS